MPRAELNDLMMLMHAAGLIILAVLIYRAAHQNQPGFWKKYPPELFLIWGTQVLVDGLIYIRRFLNRHNYFEFAEYDSWVSVFLNVIAVILLVMLMYRIFRGPVTEEK